MMEIKTSHIENMHMHGIVAREQRDGNDEGLFQRPSQGSQFAGLRSVKRIRFT
jgi:hypothetical protein